MGVANRTKDEEDFYMNDERNRLKSFKNWPFEEGCNCTPEKMAAAGFYHTPTLEEPDLAKCFMCLKELDGWEPNDDPWEEHKSHSGHCPFLKSVPMSEMTVKQCMELEQQRQTLRINKFTQSKVDEFKKYAAQTRTEIERLA